MSRDKLGKLALQLSRSGNKSRPTRRLDGNGIVTTRRGREIKVQYHLCFPAIDPDAVTEDPSKAEAQQFSGQVWCPYDGSFVTVYSDKILTLRMEDGRRLRFCYQDRDGAIVVTEWLG
jgi:hypothetical protein